MGSFLVNAEKHNEDGKIMDDVMQDEKWREVAKFYL